MTGRWTFILIALAALVTAPSVFAGRIDPESVTIEYGTTGLQVVERRGGSAMLFDFAPFPADQDRVVPGFSDPLGAGSDPGLKLFSGRVHHMDLLGDFHPSNPHDPQEVAPTLESLQADQLVNDILYGDPLPNRKQLLLSQLNLVYTGISAFSDQPKTTETSPLALAGFGSVSDLPIPIHLHWTHCPDYSFKRFLMDKTKKASPALRRTRPRLDCFVI